MKRWIVSGFLFAACAAQAVDLTLSDAAIGWNEEKFITLTVSNIAPGANVELALYADLSSDGAVQAGIDPLVFAYELADGETNHVLDQFAIGDRDGTANGVLSARISYHGMDAQIMHTAGDYLWMARSGGDTAWQPFAINPPAGAYCIQGTVRELVTSNTPVASVVFLEPFSDDDWPCPQVWARTNGTFEICLPPSIPPVELRLVGAMSPSRLSAEDGPGGEPLSCHFFTNAIPAGTNVLSRPLYVANTGTIESVELVLLSGQVLLDGGDETNALPGVIVYMEMWEGDVWALDVTDTNGAFRLPVPKEYLQANLYAVGYNLNIREVVGTGIEFSGDVTGDIVTNLICRPGEFMAQGVATNAAGAGIAGLDVMLVNDSLSLVSFGVTGSNGLFEAVVTAGSNWLGFVEEDSALTHGYLAPASSPSLTFTSDITGLNIFMEEGFLVSGTVYDSATNALFGGEVHADEQGGEWWIADMPVNHAGAYRLRVPGERTYDIRTSGFSGYAAGTITNIGAVEGGSSSNLNFYLGAGGLIRGTLTGGGAPVDGWIEAYRDNGFWLEYANDADVNGDGSFEVTIEPGSDYVLYANGGEEEDSYWVGEYYDDTFDSSLAQRFNLSAGEIVSNININLGSGGAVSGTLTAGGEAVSNGHWISVSLWQDTGAGWKWIADDWAGNGDSRYRVVVPAGTNYIVKSGGWPYRDEFYDNVANSNLAQRFTIVEGTTVSNINMDLALQAYTLTGGVQDQQTYAFISNIVLTAWNGNYTNSTLYSGPPVSNYTLTVPVTEQVRLRAEHLTNGWVGEYYADTYSEGGAFLLQYPDNWTNVCHFVLHRTGADSDHDGIPDSQEDSVPDGFYNGAVDYADRSNPDTDGDGFDDGDEQFAGTNPENSGDLLAVSETVENAAGRVILTWASVPGRIYTVQNSTNLLTGPWSGVYTSTATATVSSYTNILSGSRRYYRVQIAAP